MLKKTTLLAALLLTALLSVAKPVGIGRASDVAAAFFPGVDLNVAEMGDIYLFTPVDGPGFVLVAADDCVRPVLAYSRDGAFDPKTMPDHVADWISAYNREIASLREAGATPSAAVQALWEQLPDVNETVAPLMTTQWNQSPYYNNRCPVSPTNSRHAVTGCVATAMAQVMKYWNHPAVGHVPRRRLGLDELRHRLQRRPCDFLRQCQLSLGRERPEAILPLQPHAPRSLQASVH